MSMKKVIETAILELGVTEWPKGSNEVKYNDAYYGKKVSGKDYAWCLTFLWWVFQTAGERTAFFGGGKTARCSVLLRWYQEQGLTVPVGQVQRGDIVMLNFSDGISADHCGLVIERDGNTVKTVEGNTSPGEEGSQDNGGCVAFKTRYPYQIVGVCRPQYKEEEMPKDDVTGHWAQQSIRWAEANNLMEGYPDGTFRPNEPVLRGEEATILYRNHEMVLKEMTEMQKEIARLREEVRQPRGEDDRR